MSRLAVAVLVVFFVGVVLLGIQHISSWMPGPDWGWKVKGSEVNLYYNYEKGHPFTIRAERVHLEALGRAPFSLRRVDPRTSVDQFLLVPPDEFASEVLPAEAVAVVMPSPLLSTPSYYVLSRDLSGGSWVVEDSSWDHPQLVLSSRTAFTVTQREFHTPRSLWMARGRHAGEVLSQLVLGGAAVLVVLFLLLVAGVIVWDWYCGRNSATGASPASDSGG